MNVKLYSGREMKIWKYYILKFHENIYEDNIFRWDQINGKKNEETCYQKSNIINVNQKNQI